MITTLFLTSMICAAVSGYAFFTADGEAPTRRDKIAGICLGISVTLLVVIAYVAGAR